MNSIEVNQKIESLKQLRDILDRDQYKLLIATIYTNYYLKKLEDNDMCINRQSLVDRVNLMLYKNHADEVSYNFFRKFNINI